MKGVYLFVINYEDGFKSKSMNKSQLAHWLKMNDTNATDVFSVEVTEELSMLEFNNKFPGVFKNV